MPGFYLHSVDQVIAHAQRIGHDRQRRIDRAAGDEEAAVDDVKIIQIVRFAVHIERARFGIAAEAHRADLMRNAGQRDSLADEQIAREEAFVAVVAVRPCIWSAAASIPSAWRSDACGPLRCSACS
mgnify:CR=1 FL=1